MAATPVTLPEGFKLDAPAPLPKTPARPAGLPEGFTLDEPPAQEKPGFWQNFLTAITSPVTAGGPLAMAGREGMREIDRLMEKGAYEAGGAVTDIASGAGATPEVAGGAGYAANVGVRAIPTVIGALTGKGAEMATRPVGRKLMQSALKPGSKDLASGDAAKAIDTMLEGGFNVTPGGVAKMRALVNNLSDDVERLINQSPATIGKPELRREILDTLKRFTMQVNPKADRAAILKSWNEFKQTIGDKIPVQVAQEIKKGTYRILADKYAHMGTVGDEAGTQAQMAIARGLRKGIEKGVPEVVEPNKQMASLINAIELAERRAGIAGNRDIAGLAWLAEHPTAAAGMLADRSQTIKSLLARYLYSGMPATGAVGGTVLGTRGENVRQQEQERLTQQLKDLLGPKRPTIAQQLGR